MCILLHAYIIDIEDVRYVIDIKEVTEEAIVLSETLQEEDVERNSTNKSKLINILLILCFSLHIDMSFFLSNKHLLHFILPERLYLVVFASFSSC